MVVWEEMAMSLTNLSNVMLAVKKSAGIAPDVNLGIRCMQAMKQASGESILSLKPRLDIRSKTGVLPTNMITNDAAHSDFETQGRHHQKSK